MSGRVLIAKRNKYPNRHNTDNDYNNNDGNDNTYVNYRCTDVAYLVNFF